MTTRPPLAISEVLALATIINAATAGARIAFFDPDTGATSYGTARHIVTDPENAGFPNFGDDIRDCFLRVTMHSGFERFEPVEAVVEGLRRSTFYVLNT